MKLIKLAAFILVPALIGFLASSFYSSGLFSRWEKLSSPSADEVNLLTEMNNGGSNYYAEEKSAGGYKIINQACDSSMAEFSIISNKPKASAECVQSTHFYIDGYERMTIVRDDEGNYWKWQYLFTAIKSMGNVFWPIIGLILGLILAIIFRKRIFS